MTQGRIRDHLYLFREIADGVKTVGREVGHCVAVDQFGDHRVVGVVLILGDQVDDGGAGAERTAERSLAGITTGSVVKHVIGKHCVRKADFFFHEAEDPQPCAGASATFFVIILVPPISCLTRVKLGVFPG